MKFKTKVCYILSYYFPKYVRTKTLIDGLKAVEEIEVYEAINTHTGILRYPETFLKLLWIRLTHKPDIYVLGFRGYELFWLIRLITIPHHLIIDHMMSPYDSLVHETRKFKKGDLFEKLVYFYERSVLVNANLILTDTPSHREYFADLFDIPKEKIHSVYVGADESLFNRKVSGRKYEGNCFFVFFYGSFLPLHGVDVILDAAERLKGFPICFALVGGNRKDLTSFHKKLRDNHLDNIRYYEWIDYRELPKWIAGADLCLGGPFGNTGQANRVISGKTFQFLAMSKPCVVGKTEEDYGFVDKENCLLVPQGDYLALAKAIFWAFEHRKELEYIGGEGYKLYKERFSLRNISSELTYIVERHKPR